MELNRKLEAEVHAELETFRSQYKEFQRESAVKAKELQTIRADKQSEFLEYEREKSELEKALKKLREEHQNINKKNEEFLESKLQLISSEMTLINQEKVQ